MTAIGAFLKQKKDSPYGVPEKGQTRRFTITDEQKKNKPGETYKKAANEGEGFGMAYTVLKAESVDYSDDHGNVAFSLMLEPSSQEGAGAGVGGGDAPAPASDKDDQIARAVAFKGAVRVTAYRVQNGSLAPEQVVEEISLLTDSLVAVVTGAGKPANPPQAEPTPSGDPGDDIPF